MSLTNSIDPRQVATAIALVLVGCGGPAREAPPAATPAAAPTSSTRPAVPDAEAPEWHYEGAEGPAKWGTLSPAFAACGEGRHQSPIDITSAARAATAEQRTAFPFKPGLERGQTP